MKHFSFKAAPFLLAGAFFLSAFTLKLANTNFSGKWKLNESKSELGQFANFATKTMEAQQTDNAISISRTAASFDGNDVTSKEALTFDGKEAESTVFGESKRKATASWSADGKIFTITYSIMLNFNGETNEIKGKEIWTLSDDGKSLTVKTTSSSSFGDMETKAVYEKQ
jgi:hypothetical protein